MPRVVPSPHLQPSSTFPGHNLIKDCIDDKPNEKIQMKRHNAGIHDKKHNPLHQSVKKDIQLQSIYKHMSVSDGNTIAGTAHNENYQEYLQGSLSRYIQNMKVM